MGSCLLRNDGVIMISAPGQDRFGSMPADGVMAAVDILEQIEYETPHLSDPAREYGMCVPGFPQFLASGKAIGCYTDGDPGRFLPAVGERLC
jgi:hypothetical protein